MFQVLGRYELTALRPELDAGHAEHRPVVVVPEERLAGLDGGLGECFLRNVSKEVAGTAVGTCHSAQSPAMA